MTMSMERIGRMIAEAVDQKLFERLCSKYCTQNEEIRNVLKEHMKVGRWFCSPCWPKKLDTLEALEYMAEIVGRLDGKLMTKDFDRIVIDSRKNETIVLSRCYWDEQIDEPWKVYHRCADDKPKVIHTVPWYTYVVIEIVPTTDHRDKPTWYIDIHRYTIPKE